MRSFLVLCALFAVTARAFPQSTEDTWKEVDVGDVCVKYPKADTKCCTANNVDKDSPVCMWAAFKGCVPAVSGHGAAISKSPPADPTCGHDPQSPFYVAPYVGPPKCASCGGAVCEESTDSKNYCCGGDGITKQFSLKDGINEKCIKKDMDPLQLKGFFKDPNGNLYTPQCKLCVGTTPQAPTKLHPAFKQPEDVCVKYPNADTKCCTANNVDKDSPVCMWAAFKGCVPAVSGHGAAISKNPPADPTCGHDPQSPFYVQPSAPAAAPAAAPAVMFDDDNNLLTDDDNWEVTP